MGRLSWDQLYERIETSDAPFSVRLDGPVVVHLFFEPEWQRLGLRVPRGDAVLGSSPLAQVQITTPLVGGSELVEIATEVPTLFPYFHGFALSVADRVQLDGFDPNEAVNECVARWQDLLRSAGRLGAERELGLLGELYLLAHLIGHLGPTDALAAWTGPTRAAHDFRFAAHEVEVKTTRGEHREHFISSDTQLVASEGCLLWLLSLQFTAAGPGQGWTLPDAVRGIRARLRVASLVRSFDQTLRDVFGLDPTGLSAYTGRVKLRTAPYLVPINAAFPRLNPADALEPQLLARVSDVRYRVHVDGLGYPPGSIPFVTVLGDLAHVTA